LVFIAKGEIAIFVADVAPAADVRERLTQSASGE
jgi:hypothetical protein